MQAAESEKCRIFIVQPVRSTGKLKPRIEVVIIIRRKAEPYIYRENAFNTPVAIEVLIDGNCRYNQRLSECVAI
jgi:hypothetical protein